MVNNARSHTRQNRISLASIWLLGLGSAAVLISLMIYIVLLERKEQLRDAQLEARDFSSFIASDVEKTIYGINNLFNGLMPILDLKDRDKSLIPDPFINKELRQLQQRTPYMMKLFLTDAQGQVRYWSGEQKPTPDPANSFIKFHQKPARTPLYVGRPEPVESDSQIWFFPVSLALRDSDTKQLRWILVAQINLQFFENHFEEFAMDSGVTLTLFSLDGFIYARYPRHQADTGIRIEIPTEIIERPDIHHALELISPIDQRRRIVSAQPVGEYGLFAAASYTQQEWLHQWSRKSLSRMLLALLGSLAILLLTYGVSRHQQRQHRSSQRLAIDASTDPLTGLYNRRYLFDFSNRVLKRIRVEKQSLSLIMLDIDHFKSINDQYGHDIGDVVLKHFASLLQSSVRTSDTISRYGGEEFVVLLPQANLNSAKMLAETIRERVERSPYSDGNKLRISLTTSAGIAEWNSDEQQLDDALKRADLALYQAKQQGRNRVCQ